MRGPTGGGGDKRGEKRDEADDGLVFVLLWRAFILVAVVSSPYAFVRGREGAV